MSYITFLDVEKEIIRAHRGMTVSDRIVESVIKGIYFQEEFDPCDVQYNPDGSYILDYDGIHRAVGHFIEGNPLKVRVLDSQAYDHTCDHYVHIGLIEFKNREDSDREFERRIKTGRKYY